jgi:hypothetical protein
MGEEGEEMKFKNLIGYQKSPRCIAEGWERDFPPTGDASRPIQITQLIFQTS